MDKTLMAPRQYVAAKLPQSHKTLYSIRIVSMPLFWPSQTQRMNWTYVNSKWINVKIYAENEMWISYNNGICWSPMALCSGQDWALSALSRIRHLLSLIDSGFDKYSSQCDTPAYGNSNENRTFHNGAYAFLIVAIWLQSICIYSLLVENRLVLHHCRKPFTI